VELRAGNFGENDLFSKTSSLADEDPTSLGQSLDDQRGGHYGITRKMIVQMLFGQGQVLDGAGKLTASEFEKLVDPDPSHCVEYPPKRLRLPPGPLSNPGRPDESIFKPLPPAERPA
jgi:hypothetical protein